ncbi:hypothetical protein [Streptomyces virginiae]|uniref:hypothetical protein n=1 Tax=Streptomyces virginiae TaxID=1961 RepID=UPI003322BE92
MATQDLGIGGSALTGNALAIVSDVRAEAQNPVTSDNIPANHILGGGIIWVEGGEFARNQITARGRGSFGLRRPGTSDVVFTIHAVPPGGEVTGTSANGQPAQLRGRGGDDAAGLLLNIEQEALAGDFNYAVLGDYNASPRDVVRTPGFPLNVEIVRGGLVTHPRDFNTANYYFAPEYDYMVVGPGASVGPSRNVFDANRQDEHSDHYSVGFHEVSGVCGALALNAPVIQTPPGGGRRKRAVDERRCPTAMTAMTIIMSTNWKIGGSWPVDPSYRCIYDHDLGHEPWLSSCPRIRDQFTWVNRFVGTPVGSPGYYNDWVVTADGRIHSGAGACLTLTAWGEIFMSNCSPGNKNQIWLLRKGKANLIESAAKPGQCLGTSGENDGGLYYGNQVFSVTLKGCDSDPNKSVEWAQRIQLTAQNPWRNPKTRDCVYGGLWDNEGHQPGSLSCYWDEGGFIPAWNGGLEDDGGRVFPRSWSFRPRPDGFGTLTDDIYNMHKSNCLTAYSLDDKVEGRKCGADVSQLWKLRADYAIESKARPGYCLTIKRGIYSYYLPGRYIFKVHMGYCPEKGGGDSRAKWAEYEFVPTYGYSKD